MAAPFAQNRYFHIVILTQNRYFCNENLFKMKNRDWQSLRIFFIFL